MTTETLMTQPPQTNSEGPAESNPGIEAGTAPATLLQEPTATEPAADAAPAAEQQPAPGAPESYSFTAPEGATLDGSVTDAFAGVAKELNLTQEAAQKVVDKMAPLMAQRQGEQVANLQAEWRQQATADKEFGGQKLEENLVVARKAMHAFASPELKQLLAQTGLGNHPEVIRMFVKAGKSISEDGFVQGGTAVAKPKSAAEILYDNRS